VLPALWLMLGVTLGLITERHASSADWWHYLLLVHVYDHHEVDPNLSQLWTLSAELAFYALLPLIGLFVERCSHDPASALRWHLRVIVSFMAIALAFNIIQNQVVTERQAQLWIPAYLDWFALGMLLSVVSSVPRQRLRVFRRLQHVLHEWAAAPGTCWTAAAILWLSATTQLGTPRVVALPSFWQWTIQHYLFGASALLIMIPLTLGDGGPAGRLLGKRVGGILGNLSYSIYLWHLPLLLLLQRELGFNAFTGHFWPLLALTTLASVVVAAVSWYGLERPILRYGSRPWRVRGKPPASAKKTAATVSS
jgi:peptidoglycan/LPS O-acetylase OafA/YrhL